MSRDFQSWWRNYCLANNESNSYFAAKAAFDSADSEIESLRAQLAAANAEVQEQARLNGMGAEREAKLRAQLAEVTRENESLKRDFNRETVGQIIAALHADVDRKTDQLLATQAHAARLAEVVSIICTSTLVSDHGLPKYGISISDMKTCKAALSTTINLDALHEDRALECERLAQKHGAYLWLYEEAAAHRAKKEGK